MSKDNQIIKMIVKVRVKKNCVHNGQFYAYASMQYALYIYIYI